MEELDSNNLPQQPKSPVWPALVGILIVILIIAAGVAFYIYNSKKPAKQTSSQTNSSTAKTYALTGIVSSINGDSITVIANLPQSTSTGNVMANFTKTITVNSSTKYRSFRSATSYTTDAGLADIKAGGKIRITTDQNYADNTTLAAKTIDILDY